jgi:O-antigen chain-terminating methyltransferase
MAGASRDGSNDSKGRRPGWARALYRLTPWSLRRAIDEQSEAVRGLGLRLEDVDAHLATLDRRFDGAEEAIRGLQVELERLRDQRLAEADHRFDRLEASLAELRDTVVRVRDVLIPAVVDRGNLLVDRLARELDEVASLVERILRAEPLPVLATGREARELSAALADVQPRLIEAFRGGEDEIRGRMDGYLPALQSAAPVLDLGCGRGELLVMLREAGVEAAGVESDFALVQAALRRGLEVAQGDALESLRSRPAESLGAITAIHLLEHLEPGLALELIAEARRVLRPGGTLLVECPNPHTIRVGASDYWIDPTHRRPLPPETLELFAITSGLEVERIDFLRPYPDEQRLASGAATSAAEAADEVAALAERVERLAGRLDDVLNGPRDYVLVARKPTTA